ncbi:hypothetical protein TNCV_73251 [Trichonephila clavipes]|nr:hypothetical protein TNCV_73251 [Trichonephila clavipes]
MEHGKPVAILPRVGVCAVIGDKTGKCIDAEVMSSSRKGCDSGNEERGQTRFTKSGQFFTLKRCLKNHNGFSWHDGDCREWFVYFSVH